MKLTDEDIKNIMKILSTREFIDKICGAKVSVTNKQLAKLVQKKLTDKDIKSLLKVMPPSELIKRYTYGEISISSEQVTKLIEMKNGEREKYDD
jgi:hypothetical protein